MVIYTVYADNLLIHHSESSAPEVKLITPKLSMEENTSGSFSFILPPLNAGYDNVSRITTEIKVKRQVVDSQTGLLGKEKEIWSGRVIDEKEDFFKNRQITCEGALSYLNDTIQPQAKYENYTPESMLRALINKHNDRVENKHKFQVGAVSVHDPDTVIGNTNYETDFESTLDCINTKLLGTCGGHLVLYRNEVDGFNYIDYLEEYQKLNTQAIEFGKNLLDFSKSFDVSNICTVLIPLGARQEESEVDDDMDSYLTVESVNSGSIYVENTSAINTFGRIEKVIHFDDIEDASILLRRARRYLEDTQYEQLTLEVTAVDLHYLGIDDGDLFELYDTIRCTSVPHGLDRLFPIKKIEIPLDNPQDTKITIGNNTVANTLSSTLTGTNRLIQSTFSSLPSTTSVLKEAKENADQIMRQITNGYITTIIEGTDENAHSESMIFSDNVDYTKSNKYWKWNMNGLAYYKNKSELGLALTMDGSIVADRILAGTLGKREWGNYWDMETGEFILSPTNTKTDSSTTLSSYMDGKIITYDTNLNQTKVFNKLTNNGTTQGIYLYNNKVYINASYIATGILSSVDSNVQIDLTNNTFKVISPNIEVKNDGTLSLFGYYYNTRNQRYYDRKLDLSSGTAKFYYKNKNITDWTFLGEISAGSNDSNHNDLYIKTPTRDSDNLCNINIVSGNGIYLEARGYNLYDDTPTFGEIEIADSNGNNKIHLIGNSSSGDRGWLDIFSKNNINIEAWSDVNVTASNNVNIYTNNFKINNNIGQTTGTLWIQKSNGDAGYLEFENGILIDYSQPW